MLSNADRTRINAAVAAAEARTSGEIFCVVARQSSAYHEVPMAAAAMVALLLPPAALLLGLRPGLLLGWLDSGWNVAQTAAVDATMLKAVIAYAGVQAALFAAALAITWIPAVRGLLTPGAVKAGRVHARAMEQFAHRLHAARAVTGIVIYASLAERRVEIVADEDIHAKVGEALWDRAVQAALGPIRKGEVATGLIAAVEICGAALAEHFPDEGAGHVPSGDELTEV